MADKLPETIDAFHRGAFHMVQPKGREHLPAGGVQVLAGRTPLAERLDFLSVRLSRDKNDFRGGNEIGRQLRRPVRHHGVAIQLEVQQLAREGIVQEVVRFIDHEPVRDPRASPHDVQCGQN